MVPGTWSCPPWAWCCSPALMPRPTGPQPTSKLTQPPRCLAPLSQPCQDLTLAINWSKPAMEPTCAATLRPGSIPPKTHTHTHTHTRASPSIHFVTWSYLSKGWLQDWDSPDLAANHTRIQTYTPVTSILNTEQSLAVSHPDQEPAIPIVITQ